jgi:hypothetical protein
MLFKIEEIDSVMGGLLAPPSTTDSIGNESDVPGESVTDALDRLWQPTYTDPYVETSVILNTEVDTLYDPSPCFDRDTLFLAMLVEVNATGEKFALFDTVNCGLLNRQPDIRFARSAEFEGVTGDAAVSFWLDGTTGTIHYEADLDGGGKTVISVSVTLMT